MYGSFEPTAVSVPLDAMHLKDAFELATTELFGPFQIVVRYGRGKNDLNKIKRMLERMDNHLTAAVVSNDPLFIQDIVGNTVNGTTYVGKRARTTGAPQNHWFGPAGDPRGAGIGSPEAIKLVWSCHKEVVEDYGPYPDSFYKRTEYETADTSKAKGLGNMKRVVIEPEIPHPS